MKRRISYIAIFLVTLIGIVAGLAPAHAAEGRFLGKEEIILYGLGLKVEPGQQTVPKDIATIVSAYLQVPTLPPGEIPPLPEDAVVTATLRGPSLKEPLQITIRPNEPFNIPPLHVPGIHTLDNIRIISNEEVLLYGTPENVTIEVIEKLLVTEVKARPLTADEIREKGIVFDSSNFQAYNFTAAFAIEPGKQIKVDFPVVLPTVATTGDVNLASPSFMTLSPPTLTTLNTIIPDTLKIAQTKIPNLSVQTFYLRVEDPVSGEFIVPPIPGVVVIPGDIGFLNQFFSVMLMVGNVAPANSNLVVENLRAEIVLPAGNDTVVGTSDDPLKMAMTGSGESLRIQPVSKPGADGLLGTADDEDFLAPGESGNAEYLVEGRREGTHTIEMEITGTLTGLPVGPVTVRGRAAGTVLVRNPNFTLTFTHPNVVNAGEEYPLNVTVTNTTDSPANLVSVNLYPRDISGATLLCPDTEPDCGTQEIETILPGDSETVSFTLESKVSGKVFAATLDSDDKVAGRFRLKTSVGELGVPLSPDSLVLPKEARSLPRNLRDAAIGLLGKAYAVATAPGAALPKDVKRFSKKIVWDRAIEVAMAGMRHTMNKPPHLVEILGTDEPLADTAKQLLMDFMGSNYTRLSQLYAGTGERQIAEGDFQGFDELRRKSLRGDVFASAVAGILADDLLRLGLSAFHRDFAEKVSYRPQHISVMVSASGGPLPFNLSLVDSEGRRLGGSGWTGETVMREKVIKEIPYGDYMIFKDSGGTSTGQMAIISVPQSGNYTIRLDKVAGVSDDTPYSLSIVVPDASGVLRHIVYQNITGLDAPTLEFTSGEPYRLSINLFFDGGQGSGQPVTPTSDEPVIDPPPTVISVVQQPDADIVRFGDDCGFYRFGRVVAVLFSEDVTPESVQHNLQKGKITHYAPEENEVVGVALQPGRRIAFLALRDPVGPFIQKEIKISGVGDLGGQIMTPWAGPIEATIEDEGGAVSGNILHADGSPVFLADVRLFGTVSVPAADGCKGRAYGISAKMGSGGGYSWDYLLRKAIPSKIVAIDQETGEMREVPFTIFRNGQRLNVNIVFPGMGILQGRTLAEDGVTPLPGTMIKVTTFSNLTGHGLSISGAGTATATRGNMFSTVSDKDGWFILPRIPVGNILIEAVYSGCSYESTWSPVCLEEGYTGSKVTLSDYIPSDGMVLEKDLVLLSVARRLVMVKYGDLSGHVLRSDGITPAGNMPVSLFYKNRSQEGVVCPMNVTSGNEPDECVVALTNTNSSGAFSFSQVPAGEHRVYSFDQAGLEEGEARIVLPAGGAADVNVLLSGGFGVVRGVVLDADGNPVAGAIVGGGLSLTTTNELGEFVLTDVPVGKRDIVAVAQELGTKAQVTVDVLSDGVDVGSTIVLDPVGTVKGTVFESDGITPVPDIEVYLFEYAKSAGGGGVNIQSGGGTKIGIVAMAVTDSGGHYQMDRVRKGNYTLSAFTASLSKGNVIPVVISGHRQVVKADVVFKGSGRISGIVLDSDGNTPLKARVSVSGLRIVKATGGDMRLGIRFEYVENAKVVDNDLSTGRFSFDGIFAGPFVIRAAGPFSPDPVTFSGEMPSSGGAMDVTLQLQPTSEIRGIVYQPDGYTPVGRDVKVTFKSSEVTVVCREIEQGVNVNSSGSSASLDINLLEGTLCTEYPRGIQEEVVVTDDQGRFWLPIVNPGKFTLTVSDPVTGMSGMATGTVQAGQTGEIPVRLMGFGDVSVRVYGSDGVTPVQGARVTVEQIEYPKVKHMAIAGPDGVITFSGGDALSEGPFTVFVEDLQNGFAGRASGKVTEDGEAVTVSVYINDSTGTVYGTVYRPDGITPAPNAEVILYADPYKYGSYDPGMDKYGYPLSFAVTDANGQYRVEQVPLGVFEVKVYDPVTGRTGQASGRIDLLSQEVPVNIIFRPIGQVQGIVVAGEGLTPLGGWDVRLSPSDISTLGRGSLRATTGRDGRFSFPGVSVGTFTLIAENPQVPGSGRAEGRIIRGGEIVDIPIVVNLVKPPLGRIAGIVYNPDGTTASNSEVCIPPGFTALGSTAGVCDIKWSRHTTTDSDGAFVFEDIPLGRYHILVKSQITEDSGSGVVEVAFSGETAYVAITMTGLGRITGTAYRDDGDVAPYAMAILQKRPEAGCGLSECTTYADSNGRFEFAHVPSGNFNILIEDPVTGLSGSAGGTLNPGGTVDIRVVLEPTGIVTGRVLFGDGRPAQGILVELKSVDRTEKTLYLYTESGADGIFTFSAVPMVAWNVNFEDPIGPGIAARSLRVTGSHDLGDISLDEAPPTVSSIAPVPGALSVPVESVIRITFSEPVQPGTMNSSNILVSRSDGVLVNGYITMGEGDTTATFAPLSPLTDETRYMVRVKGIKDRLDRIMARDFASSFTTVDIKPPVTLDVNPASNTGGVSIDSVIRVKYSEPVNPGGFSGTAITLSMVTALGNIPVSGRVDMILENTGVVFTPDRPLDEDARYHVSILPSVDRSGNAQASGMEYDFSTTDRTAPVIQTLITSNNGVVIEGGVGTVTADVGMTYDVSFVDFFINDVLSLTDRQAPFEMSLMATASLGGPGDTIRVSAIATDTSGNRGEVSEATFTINADSTPVATITSPLSGVNAATGEMVSVTVQGTDDMGITKIGYQATGGQPPASAIKDVSPPGISASFDFTFYVPLDAIPGSIITVNATVIDTRGQTGKAAPVEIIVQDATPPTVSFTGITTGEKVKPGERVTVVVTASDAGSIALLNFKASGATAYSETRQITPAQGSVVTSFSFTVSQAASPLDRVTLEAEAVDQAGNRTSTAKIILPVADTIAPAVTLRTGTGHLEIVPGRDVTVIAEGSDEMGITRFELTGSGLLTLSDARAISPPLGSAQSTFIINVPETALAGSTLTLQAKAMDISGNAGLSAPMMLTVRSLPDITFAIAGEAKSSIIIMAGDAQAVTVQISEPAPAEGLRVDLSSENTKVATVSSYAFFNEGDTTKEISVNGVAGGTTTVNASIQGVMRGSMTVVVQGGVVTGTVYNPFPVPAAGVEVNVNGVLTTTGEDGRFFVDGVNVGSPLVTVKAFDPVTRLKGYASAFMNAWNGYARDINVALVPAGSVSGTVVLPDEQTPAGAGVQVSIFNPGNLHNALQILFTDENSRFEFPLVAIGNYVIEASDVNGNRGRSNITVGESGQEVEILLTYEGRGTVSGIVLDGGGNPVANAIVTLTSYSLFGGTMTTTAELDGTFRIDGVFIGTFTISAKDDRTEQVGNTAGYIGSHQETVDVSVSLAPWASLEGYVYRPDGITPVAGAKVYIYGYPYITTDSEGYYRFDILKLGTYTVKVTDEPTRDSAERGISLQTNGRTERLDITLAGQQGTVVVTVVDANDSAVSGALVQLTDGATSVGMGWIKGATGTDGIAVFNYVRAGSFSVTATAGGLNGSAIGTVTTGAVAEVTVRLEPTASITGTVFGPDGLPAPGICVNAYGPYGSSGRSPTTSRYATGPDGIFTFEYLRLGTYTLSAHIDNGYCGLSGGGVLRAKVSGIVLNTNDQVENRDMTLVGLGTVTGRVLMPDSSSAPDMQVTVRSVNPDFGKTFFTKTNAAGYYLIGDVPVGNFTVSTGDISRQLLGEGEGMIEYHGQTVDVPIILQNNAVTLPRVLRDGNILRYNIRADGTLDVSYSGYLFSTTSGGKGGDLLEIVSGGVAYPFTGGLIPTQEDKGREIALRQDNIAGLNVTRKVFVPMDGYFARYIEMLTNPTSGPITIDVSIRSSLSNSASLNIVDTSSGDNILTTSATAGDRWVLLNDSNAAYPLPSSFLWEGQGATDVADTAVFTARTSTSPPILTTGFTQITIQPGESVAYMHFVIPQMSVEGAKASAGRLIQLPPEAMTGLSAAEISMIKNFAVPSDGSSALQPLPPLTGKITGRLLASDGVTSLVVGAATGGSKTVYIKSNNIFFGQTYSAYADYQTGYYTFDSNAEAESPGGNSNRFVRIPVDDFTVWARGSIGSGYSPTFSGSFQPGLTSATRDIIFTNTGMVEGVVRTYNGEAVSGAMVVATMGAGPNFVYNATIYDIQNGYYKFFLLPPGDLTITAAKSHSQGTALTASGIATVVEGLITNLDITLPPVGTFTGIVRSSAGLPVYNAQVRLNAGSFSRATTTDGSGRYTFTEVPAGSYTLTASEPINYYLTISTPVTVTGGDTVLAADLTLIPSGRITGTVYFADGTPVSSGTYATIQIMDGTTQNVLKQIYTGSNGAYDTGYFSSNAAGLLIRATRQFGPVSTTVEDVIPGFTSFGQQVTANLRFSGNYGRITGSFRFADGQTAVVGSRIDVLDSSTGNLLGTYNLNSTLGTYDFGFYFETSGNYIVKGTYSYTISNPTRQITVSAEQSVAAFTASNQSAAVNLILEGNRGSIRGTVYHADGSTGTGPGYGVEVIDSTGVVVGSVSVYYTGGAYNTGNIVSTPNPTVRAYYTYSTLSGDRTIETIQNVQGFNVSGQTLTQNITLPVNRSSVRARVYTDTGATFTQSVRIDAYSPADNSLIASCNTSSGQCTLSNLVAGADGVKVRAVYGTNTTEQIVFITTSNTTVDISFTITTTTVFGGMIRGSIFFADGARRANYAYPAVEVLDGTTRDLLKTISADSIGDYDTGYFTSSAASFIIRASWQYSIYSGTRTVSVEQTVPGFTSNNTFITQNLSLPVNRGSIRARVLSGIVPFGAESVRVEVRDPLDGTLLRFCDTGLLGSGTGVCTCDQVVANAEGVRVIVTHGPDTAEQIVNFTASDITVDVDLLLPFVEGNISGKVYEGDPDRTINDVTVEAILASDGSLLKSTVTANGGAYTLNNISVAQTEDIIIRASYAGAIMERRVNFADSQNLTGVDFALPLSFIRGNVYAGDGATVVNNARVEVIRRSDGYVYASASTNFNGIYMTGLFYPGTEDVIVRVTWPEDYCNGGECTASIPTVFAEQTETFAETGERKQVDLTLPVSVVKGMVYKYDGVTPIDWPSVFANQTDAGGNGVDYFSRNYGAGRYDVLGIPMGDFMVLAQDGNTGLYGEATGTITDVTQPLILDIILGPSGTIRGQVLDNGAPVAYSAELILRIDAINFERTTWTDEDGFYVFEEVPVGNFTLIAVDTSTRPPRYSNPIGGILNNQGEVVTFDMSLQANGTVSGTVYAADGLTPMDSISISIKSQASGRSEYYYNVLSDSNGRYTTAVIPGAIMIQASQGGRIGTASGDLTSGGTLILDLSLSGFDLSYGYNLDGADGFRYDVYTGAALADGGTSDGRLSGAYEGAYYLLVNEYGMGSYVATLEDDNREIVIGPETLNGLLVTRKVFVPAVGGFARYIDLIYNPGNIATMDVKVWSNLGSGSDARIFSPPSDNGDTYAVTYDGLRSDPSLAHVFGGLGGGVPITTIWFEEGYWGIEYDWYNVQLSAGETKCFMHFAVQREPDDEAGAKTQAEALANLTDPNALSGMSDEERACVVNFNVP